MYANHIFVVAPPLRSAHADIQVAIDPEADPEDGPALDLEGNVEAEPETETVVDVVVVSPSAADAVESSRLLGLRRDLHRPEVRDFAARTAAEFRKDLATAQREADACPPASDKCISLVATTEDCFFVRWVAFGSGQFRRVTLDKRGRIVTIVATWVPIETLLDGARVVIRDVGVRMVVAKAEGRPSMPSWCLLLQRKQVARLYPGPLVRRVDDSSDCAACLGVQRFYEGSAEVTGQNARPRSADMFSCGTCTQRWHLECATFYSDCADDLRLVAGTSDPDALEFVCPFCHAS
jgi:hypothetical protein